MRALKYCIVVLIAMTIWATLVTLLGQHVLVPWLGYDAAATIRFILSCFGGGMLSWAAMMMWENG